MALLQVWLLILGIPKVSDEHWNIDKLSVAVPLNIELEEDIGVHRQLVCDVRSELEQLKFAINFGNNAEFFGIHHVRLGQRAWRQLSREFFPSEKFAFKVVPGEPILKLVGS